MGVSIEQLTKYEQGELDDDEVIELFQGLLDTGMAFKFQGCYGRTALELIDKGLIEHKWRAQYGRRSLY